MNEEFPRLHVYRGPRRKGVRYFGPFAHAWAIRETLDLLLRVFPARTCSAGVFKRHGQIGRPCLLGYIDKCSAPCVGRVDADEHRDIVEDFCDFLAGRTDPLIRQLERRMAQASEELEFEQAARLRDDIGALRRAMERQAVVLGGGTDADVVAFADDELEAAVQVFHVRGGRVRGQRGWVIDKVEPTDTAAARRALPHPVLRRAGGAGRASTTPTSRCPGRSSSRSCPPSVDVADRVAVAGCAARGCRVRVPQRGDKRALAETVARNAAEALTQHKLRRAGDLTARSAALAEIAGRARAGLRAAADRVHRRLARAGHQRGRLAGRVRGRAGRASRTTGGSRSATARRAATSPRSPRSCARRFRRYLAETEPVDATASGARPITDRDLDGG